MFQSAPRSRERGDTSQIPIREQSRPVSIRAPLTRAGRLSPVSDLDDQSLVSIRAPLTRAGRLFALLFISISAWFQSAPRSRERGDSNGRSLTTCLLAFQSAPRSRERGDRFAPCDVAAVGSFQSAPRSRERGDPFNRSLTEFNNRFNPRPAHASGATLQSTDSAVCFNPRPAHAAGRLTAAIGVDVSIRAPLTRAGRPGALTLRIVTFQSAPRSAAGRLCLSANRRSEMFQSAPRSRERGDTLTRSTRCTRDGQRRIAFQSAPRPRGRGDCGLPFG